MKRYRGLFIMAVFMVSMVWIDATHMAPLAAQAPSVPVGRTLPSPKATDRVPVIVTLKNTNGFERPFDSVATKTARRKKLRMHRIAF